MQVDNILTLYGQLLSRVDAWFGRCLSAAPEDIHCSKGCSHCCRGLFDITLLDACFLKSGFDKLEQGVQYKVADRARSRLEAIRAIWPEFAPPFTLNHRSDEEWDKIMPNEDETPCVLLDENGRCLVYEHRPMTCRLHGLPLVDMGGEIMDPALCSLNFVGKEPISLPQIRFEFIRLFQDELSLFGVFTGELLKFQLNELDTVIPAAILLTFDANQWQEWGRLLNVRPDH
ncbi:YkgJ family cysteine cluster protein [Geotalea toluenoxydans]|uniref:YkgJ family cysteine cluster protein n=1 Tax=Geotalea toluenoxydans TaxID=421624 RepID=UPI0006D1BD5F|nr:YkgJ family cysteine cluster protein [Geotalea toluenoxydans]